MRLFGKAQVMSVAVLAQRALSWFHWGTRFSVWTCKVLLSHYPNECSCTPSPVRFVQILPRNFSITFQRSFLTALLGMEALVSLNARRFQFSADISMALDLLENVHRKPKS